MAPDDLLRHSLLHAMPSVLEPPTSVLKERGSVRKQLPGPIPMAQLYSVPPCSPLRVDALFPGP